MFKYESVERALFSWSKWQHSLIEQWSNLEAEFENVTLGQLKLTATTGLDVLNLPSSTWLQLYWVCCVSSDYSLDYEDSFSNIVVPNWLPLPFDSSASLNIKPGDRMLPPAIYTKADLKQLGSWLLILDTEGLARAMNWIGLALPPTHELYHFLGKQRGRPNNPSRIGKHRRYSDRLSVKCAILKDEHGMTYVEIAEKMGLPITTPIFSRQSDVCRGLVSRGKKIIERLAV